MNNLYKISTKEYSWEDYDAFIICAKSENEAKVLMYENIEDSELGEFKNSKPVKIGEAGEDIEKGIVLGSFNAG